jgi:hypothetical protein
MPVIPALQKLRQQDPAGAQIGLNSETLSQKKKKLNKHINKVCN